MDNDILHEVATLVNKLNSNNVAVFVDFDNIYYSLKDYGVNLQDENFCIFSLMNTLYSKDKIRTMRAYADFEQVKISFKYLQEKRVQIKNVYGNGKTEEHRKNASDIELSIDAIETYYKDSNIDTYVFITSDSDMIPVMSRLIFKAKKVHLYYIETNTSQYQHITEYCHLSQDLLKVLGVDENRRTPNYWTDKVLELMNEWYDDPKHKGLCLGGKWLNDMLCDELSVSVKFASEIITYMSAANIIKEELVASGKKGYIKVKVA
jgi:uncharacterized LabA/DUF88 family protein